MSARYCKVILDAYETVKGRNAHGRSVYFDSPLRHVCGLSARHADLHRCRHCSFAWEHDVTPCDECDGTGTGANHGTCWKCQGGGEQDDSE